MAKRSTKINVLAKAINVWCAAKTSFNRMNAFRVTPYPKIHCKYCANIASISFSK